MEETLSEESTTVEGSASESPSDEASSLRSALEASFEKHTPTEAAAAPAAGTVVAPAAPATDDSIPQRLAGKLDTHWPNLPPEAKAAYREYESHIGNLASRYGQAAKQWEQVTQLMAPYQAMIQEAGGNPLSVVGSMLETARVLTKGSPDQKLMAVHQILQAYGIPAQRLEDGSIRLPTPRAPQDLLQRLTGLERQDLTIRATEEQNARQEVTTELDAFLADAQNVYVRTPGFLDTMAKLIAAGQAKGLSDAYEQAAWIHPQVRPLEIAKQNQATATQVQQQASQARAVASVSATGNSPGNIGRDPSKMTLRETIASALDGELA